MANERIIIQNELLYSRLKKAETNYKKSPKDRLTPAYLETRLQSLEELWKEFKDGHRILISTVPQTTQQTLSYFRDDLYETFHEQYTSYKTSLVVSSSSSKSHKTEISSNEKRENSDQEIIPLPRILLPIFNGKYEEWQSFHDIFVSLIHSNNTISKVQKLHYLKSNLKGEPEILLRNFAITENNYDEAWKQLIKRYSNKRYNCSSILKIIFEQKKLLNESASGLKQLLDTTTSCLQSLKSLGIDITSCDAFVIFLVTSKLDMESHRLWEQTLSSTCQNELPSWTQLTEFLENRFRSLEMLEPCKPAAKLPESYSASVKNENTSNDAEQNKEPSSKDVKLVLPSCDNLEKNFELACQNSIKNGASSEETHVETVPTSSSTNKLDENQENMTHHENDEHNNSNDYENTNEEHYTTLREVVNKVMQDSTILQNQPSDDGDIEDDYDYDDKDEAKSFDDSDPPSVVEVEEVLKVQEVPENTSEESKSPSQSECGRATRWEALADIAAELPPTLAVDPITGQIYSLAK